MLNQLLGNAVEVESSQIQSKFADILVENETVINGYKLLRDTIIFTTERLIQINVQGLTGSKVSYLSIPYSSVKLFSMETTGGLDLDCEIKLFVQGIGLPIDLKFKRGTDLKSIYKVLSKYTLRDN